MWRIKCFFAFALIFLHAVLAVAAATITANPNPVVILFPEKSGTTTIQWDAEASHPNAQVWLSIDGGNETVFDADYHGAKSTTIQLGKTYVFKLYTANKSLLDSVTVTSKRKFVTVPLDNIPIPFIENVDEDEHGMFARITFTTVSSSLPVVMVSDKPPLSFNPVSKEDEQVFNQSDLISSNFAQTGTIHEAILPDLESGKEFHYVISAHDNSNDQWYKVKGKFRTLQRAIAVKFEKIKVVDDSDELGDGDLSFGFFVNGKNKPNVVPLTVEESELETGESKTINMTATLSGIPATLQLKVIGYDDDGEETPYPGADFECLKPDVVAGKITDVSETEGENDCGEWSSDDDSFNIGPNAPDVTDPESFTKSFTLKAYPKGDDSDVSFDVTGTYSVAYVP